jgi:hypothetical protein
MKRKPYFVKILVPAIGLSRSLLNHYPDRQLVVKLILLTIPGRI